MKEIFTILTVLLSLNSNNAQEKLSQIGILDIQIDSSIVSPKYIGDDLEGNMYFIGYRSKSYNEIVVKRLLSNGRNDNTYGNNGFALVGKYSKPTDAKGFVIEDSKVIVYTFHWVGYTDHDNLMHSHYRASTCFDKQGKLFYPYGESGTLCKTPGIPLSVSSDQYIFYSKSDTIIKTDFEGVRIKSFQTNENNLFKTDSYYQNTYRKQRSDKTLVKSSFQLNNEIYIGASIQSQITGKYDSIVILKYKENGRLDSTFGIDGRRSIKVTDQNIMLLSMTGIDSLIYISASVWGLTQPILYVLNSSGKTIKDGIINLRKVIGFNDDTFVRGGIRAVKQLDENKISILTTFSGSKFNQYYLTVFKDQYFNKIDNYHLLSLKDQSVLGFNQLADESIILFTIIDGFLMKYKLTTNREKAKVKFHTGKLDLMFNHSIAKGEIFTASNHQFVEYKIKDINGLVIKEMQSNDIKRIKEFLSFISNNKGQYIIEATKSDKTKMRELVIIE